MLFAEAFDELEVGADSFDQLVQAVSFDIEAAAFQRAVVREGREQKISPGS